VEGCRQTVLCRGLGGRDKYSSRDTMRDEQNYYCINTGSGQGAKIIYELCILYTWNFLSHACCAVSALSLLSIAVVVVLLFCLESEHSGRRALE